MGAVFTLDFLVRDYELDQYGVLNNAVYLNYLEHTRHEFLTRVGISPARVAREGRALALAEINVRFRSPLRSREQCRVALRVAEVRGARVVIHQRMVRLPEETPVAEARAVAVLLDERGRPARLDAAWHEAFAPYLAEGPDEG